MMNKHTYVPVVDNVKDKYGEISEDQNIQKNLGKLMVLTNILSLRLMLRIK